ncbi:MAG TPA: hypothetical protein VG225_14125 [Terracidiphilus sp.]|nr:hypothetical protein [Terracidiphilus sp.]
MVPRVSRLIAACMVFLVAAQFSAAAALPAQGPQQQPAQQPAPAQPQTAPSQQPASAPDADSQTSKPGADLPQSPNPASAQTPDQGSSGFEARAQEPQHQDAQKPLGTAAAPLPRPTGVAGSRPSGAAIAPAKQRRVKALWIRVSLIVAGAAAAGAVIGLSKESPSRPQ